MSRDPRRFVWLDLNESGNPTASIARRFNVPLRTVQHEIQLARGEVAAFLQTKVLISPPKLVMFYPFNGFTPKSKCRHDVVPIPEGSVMCCGVCHRSGQDRHPALQRYVRLEPRHDKFAALHHHAD